MSVITVDGKPIEEWIKERREKELQKEVKDLYTQETKIPRYLPPIKPKHSVKGPNGSVKQLTKDEIMEVYGMESMGKLPTSAKIIWTLLNMDKYGKTSDQIFDEANLDTTKSKSPGASLATVWKRLGDEGAGLFTRIQEGRKHRYFLTDIGVKTSFENAIQLHKKAGRKSGPSWSELDEFYNSPEEKEVSNTVEEAKPLVPEKVDVNININFKILFGIDTD